ncbi:MULTISPECIES: tetratricopeptide repeat protein [unclassified Kribbella]|uniref:tetratricopeptide repeat protein n=1 Tax=unclassified Kribbella TaxID=2644121 RepID=UPI003076A79E
MQVRALVRIVRADPRRTRGEEIWGDILADHGQFDEELRKLRAAAGNLTYQAMINRAEQQKPPILLTKQALSDWFTGKVKIPKDEKAQDRLIVLLEAEAKRRDQDHRSHPIEWWRALRKRQNEPEREVLGRLIGGMSEEDALIYEVHRSIEMAQFGAPLLPPYIVRAHDAALRRELVAAKAGSRVVMLVGGSSTGKTRACWEAIRTELPDWLVWHPLTPDRPDAVMQQLTAGRVAPRTVIWLNEAQMYLQRVDVGERAASILQQLLHGAGGPILVLGSMWPDYWDELKDSDSTEHGAARALLASARRISVPPDFAPHEVAAAKAQIAGDIRLQAAVAADGGITQYLAGAPELIERYEDADAYCKAIVHAAMDARRHSRWLYLPANFLRHAALGYLSERKLGQTDDAGVWFDEALEALTKECHGADGVLAPRKILSGGNTATRYKLADYLEQHGRRRPAAYPPSSFWDAATETCEDPAALYDLTEAAARRSMLRRAAKLRSLAADRGSTAALRDLALLHEAAGDHERAEQLAREAAIHGYAGALRDLVASRDRAGDHESAVRLAREAATHGSTESYRSLVVGRDRVCDDEGAVQLAREAATHGDASALLLLAVRRDKAGDPEGAAQLAREAATHGDTDGLLQLARSLLRLRRDELAVQLLREAATHGNPNALLDLAKLQHEADDAAAAEQLLLKAATLGSPFALQELAVHRDKAGDHDSAEQFAREAATQGNTQAFHNLIQASDHERSERLAREAATHGDASAFRLLALRSRAAGDHERAEQFAREAATHGDASAFHLLALRSQAAGDHERAEQFARKAATHGDASAFHLLALRSQAAGDHERAERLLQEGAAHGYGDSLHSLALLRDRDGDHATAEQLAREAAGYGNTDALHFLALLRDRDGDHTAAERLAREAAGYGNTDALRSIALLRDRDGDHATAERLAREAAGYGNTDALRRLAEERGKAGDNEGFEQLLLDAAANGDHQAFREVVKHRRQAGDHEGGELLRRYGLSDDGTPAAPWTVEAARSDWSERG